jgi:flavin reductase (DIM6/NTAB) family NADH-FMN oxidoreductase RutF
MADDPAAALADLDYPVAVVTCSDGESRRSGCLVGFLTQCSIHPPRLLVCISRTNHTHPVALVATHLAVHWPSATQREMAELFGGRTGDEVDKFASCRWHAGAGGAPILEDCSRWIVGRVLERHPAGDHTAFLLEPVDALVDPAWPGQLGYQAVRDIEPGHLP